MGQERYSNAKRLMITADGGGSNGVRVRLWKIELQKFVDEIGIPGANGTRLVPPSVFGPPRQSPGTKHRRGVAEMAALAIRRRDFHGNWNYTVRPRPPT
jgi:hypothetical protein